MFAYNGVSLELCKSEFDWGEERDASDTDTIWSVYTIDVEGFPTVSGLPVTPSITVIREIEHLLSQPRCPLLFAPNGITLINTAGMDVAFGPRLVGRAHVAQFTSDAVFVKARYEIRLRTCGNGNNDPVISLRWQASSSFDELAYETRYVSGRLITRTDLRLAADNFRELCTPPVPNKYRRLSSKYTMNRTGTELDFDFVDQQQYTMPPLGSRKASGNFAVLVQKGNKRLGQVNVHLEAGPDDIERKGLMILAMKIAFVKLQAEGLGKVGYTILNGKFAESMFENVVDVSISADLPPLEAGIVNKGGVQQAPLIMQSVGKLGFKENETGLSPAIWSRVGGLLAAAFRDPCAAAAVGLEDADLRTVKDTGTKTELRTSPLTPKEQQRLDYSLTVGDLPPMNSPVVIDPIPYDTYKCECEYRGESGVKMMPATGIGPNGNKAKAVTMHGGWLQMVVNWTASRTGSPPVIPSKKPQDPNFILIDHAIIPEGIELGADGVSPVYCVSGQYVYGIIDPDAVNYAAPVPPFLASLYSAAAAISTSLVSAGVIWQGQGQGTSQTELQAGQPPPDLRGSEPPLGKVQEPGSDTSLGPVIGGVAGGILGGNPTVYP